MLFSASFVNFKALLSIRNNAPVNVKPQVGGGGGGGGGGRSDPREFDIFVEARVKFPTPGHLVNVKFSLLGKHFSQTYLPFAHGEKLQNSAKQQTHFQVPRPYKMAAMSNVQTRGSAQVSKSLPRGKLAESISRG